MDLELDPRPYGRNLAAGLTLVNHKAASGMGNMLTEVLQREREIVVALADVAVRASTCWMRPDSVRVGGDVPLRMQKPRRCCVVEVSMPIHQPGKVLFRNLPLSFVARRTGGHGAKSVNVEIPLIPFIDLQICLVVFLLMSFSSTGELLSQRDGLQMPKAEHTQELELAPVLVVDGSTVVLDGRRVADTSALAVDPKVERIEPLIALLEALKRNWYVLHPRDEFPGGMIMQADVGVDYRVIKKLMFAAAQAGYPNVKFAVTQLDAR